MKSSKNSKKSSSAVTTKSQQINRELYKRNVELAVRNKTLGLLGQLDVIALSPISMQKMAQQIVSAIAVEFGYEVAAIGTTSEHATRLRWLAFGSSTPSLSAHFVGLDEHLASEQIQEKKLLADKLKRISVKPSFASQLSAFLPDRLLDSTGLSRKRRKTDIRSSILYTLVFKKEPLGMLSLSSSRDLHELTKYEHESLAGVVSLVSLALYKAKLYEDLQRTTAELRAANKRLKELMEIKTEFLHIASHQLRTPLTSLRGFLDMQASGDFDQLASERRKELQKTMAKSANQLNDLVNDLLNAMELEGGTPNLKLQPTDLWQVIQEAVSTQQLAFDKKKLNLNVVKPAERLPMISADPSYLRQVFLNALDNAMKYTEKGSVTISTQTVGKNIEILIVDTGIGIDAKDMSKLFGKFVRGGQTEKLQTTGSGLGLFIMKKITEQHNGSIQLLSDGTGKGTTVRITLPIPQTP